PPRTVNATTKEATVMKRSRSATRTLLVVVTAGFLGSFTLAIHGQSGATEAPAGFDNHPVPGFYGGDAAAQQAAFDADRAVFEERDDIACGLGSLDNAQRRAECHRNPGTGAGRQGCGVSRGRQGRFGTFRAA